MDKVHSCSLLAPLTMIVVVVDVKRLVAFQLHVRGVGHRGKVCHQAHCAS